MFLRGVGRGLLWIGEVWVCLRAGGVGWVELTL